MNEAKKIAERLEYFVKAFEMRGIGQVVAEVQDSPDTCVQISLDDIKTVAAAIKTLSGNVALLAVLAEGFADAADIDLAETEIQVKAKSGVLGSKSAADIIDEAKAYV